MIGPYDEIYAAVTKGCYDASTAENRHSLVVAARNAALASGEAAERGADKEGVIA